MKRQLVLEDGTIFTGDAFGDVCQKQGELVFNTSMTGYQEILSDPSYCGQIITMTYPLIGNYGINRDDFESIDPAVFGFVVKSHCEVPSNFRSEMTLDAFLKAKKIPGISGIDTRKLTKIIRKHGSMRAILTKAGQLDGTAVTFTHSPTDQVARMSTVNPYVVPGRSHRVVVVDFGMKHGILRELTKRNCHITVVPHHYSKTQILNLNPEGVMLTNGPGDPKDVNWATEMVKEIMPHVPVFGICLGHQLISLASGADTRKMKFGHRGANHPVKDLRLNKTMITSQNHGYAVTPESLEKTDLTMTHVAINDESVEGVAHNIYPTFSVQYHPESSPGPEDTSYLFDQFMDAIEAFKQAKKESI